MRRSCALLLVVGCASQNAPAVTFDPCQQTIITAAGANDDQLASIDDAVEMWQSEGIAVTRGDSGQVAIAFRTGAEAMYGFYDDTTATILINVDLTDRGQRAITVAHELGHAFALVHVPASVRASVMNPGNLTVAPDDGDRAALAAVWGDCEAR